MLKFAGFGHGCIYHDGVLRVESNLVAAKKPSKSANRSIGPADAHLFGNVSKSAGVVNPLPQEVPDSMFYTLPTRLLDRLGKNVPALSLHEKWIEEKELSQAAERLNQCVGFRGRQPINFDLLVERKALPRLQASDFEEFKDSPDWKGINHHHLQNLTVEADIRIDWARRTAKAYCGWLLTDSDFLQEYELLASLWSDQIRDIGFPSFESISQDTSQDYFAPIRPASLAEREFAEDTKRFCIHWQLKSIPGPYLPEPLQPQFPVLESNLLTENMRKGGKLIYLPDTFALMGEEELRHLLEDVIRGTPAPKHLRAWGKFASTKRQSKGREFDRFARLFELQHYWRVLHSRWTPLVHLPKVAVKQAFADFFRVTLQQIKSDVRKAFITPDSSPS